MSVIQRFSGRECLTACENVPYLAQRLSNLRRRFAAIASAGLLAAATIVPLGLQVSTCLGEAPAAETVAQAGRTMVDCVDSKDAETIATCGKGWLERINGYHVLHLKGTPYEMGYQHGVLLKDSVRKNLDTLLRVKGDQTLVEVAGFKLKPRDVLTQIIAVQKPFVAKKFTDEMDG
ncbi:MAG TPA: hypothetical protein DDZ51_09815, partial [Planctomycetaceae bacterium]|nr:hypothetical protein [Planctomycetaceae bacterium]